MEKWTRSLFATKRSVGWAVDGTNNVSWGLILPKTTLAMDVLPDLREPMRTILGARSARSLSPSDGVAGHRSRLAYMFLRARGEPFEWCCWFECPGCGAATAREALVVVAGQWAAKGLSNPCRAVQERLPRLFFLRRYACSLVCYTPLAVL